MTTERKLQVLMMNVNLKLSTKVFLSALKEKYCKFGSFTVSQESVINRIYEENYGREPFKLVIKPFSVPADPVISKSIFSKEDVSEHFRVMKAAINGAISKQDVEQYCEMLSAVLKENGVVEEKWGS